MPTQAPRNPAAEIAFTKILDDIDTASEPSKMSKETALEELDWLIGELEFRCEALREEIAAEKKS